MAGSSVESIGHYGANAVRSRDASASRSGGIKTDRDIDSHGLKIGDGFFRSTNTHPARFGERHLAYPQARCCPRTLRRTARTTQLAQLQMKEGRLRGLL